MSLQLEGQSCQVCKAYLFQDDDVVYCPECGAPYHRDCYKKAGRCVLEELHGTKDEYRPPKQDTQPENEKEPVADDKRAAGEDPVTGIITCALCFTEYDPSLDRCPKCAAPNPVKKTGGFGQFDFLGGVPEDFDIGEGVTAKEAQNFVMSNTTRYIPKFALINKNNKTSWNWMAFIFPGAWMLSRKMYKMGTLVTALLVAFSLCLFPFSQQLYSLGMTDAGLYMDMVKIMEILPKTDAVVLILAAVGSILSLSIHVVAAIFADYSYKNYVVSQVKLIKAKGENTPEDYRKSGGVNIWAMMLGILIIQYLPPIIVSFF